MKYAFIAALISGFSIFINKFAVDAVSSPVLFTTLKNFFVGILFFLLLLSTKKLALLKSVSKKDLLNLIGVGIIGGSIPFYLFFTGLSQIPSVNGAIIQKSLVIWVALLAVPLLKEKLTLTNIVGVALLFYANVFIGGFKGFKFSTGEIMVLTATLLWSLETILIKKINLDGNLIALFRLGLGSVILFFVAPINQVASLNLNSWIWILATSGILFVYVFFWLKALKQVPAITVTSILVLSTLITNLLSSKFSFSQAALMIIGVTLLLKPYLSSILNQKLPLGLKS